MSWMQTYSGRKFNFQNIRLEDINILDIAVSLSNMCRYNGHCLTFYSVAEHSVRMANELPPHLRPWALLHDAAEAYTGDCVRPFKWLLPNFRRYERRIEQAISIKFNMVWPIPDRVMEMDERLLMTERRDILLPTDDCWSVDAIPLPQKIRCMRPDQAFQAFRDALIACQVVDREDFDVS